MDRGRHFFCPIGFFDHFHHSKGSNKSEFLEHILSAACVPNSACIFRCFLFDPSGNSLFQTRYSAARHLYLASYFFLGELDNPWARPACHAFAPLVTGGRGTVLLRMATVGKTNERNGVAYADARS